MWNTLATVHILSISSAPDTVPRADHIRTLIKDIWDLRIAKLRSSIDTFIKSDATHAKVNTTIFYNSSFKTIIIQNIRNS